MKRIWMVGVLALGVMALGGGVAVAQAEAANVLVYSGTTGWRHTGDGMAITPAVISTVQDALADVDIDSDYVDCNGDTQCRNVNPGVFTNENLAQYDAIMFFNISSSGDAPLWNTVERNAIVEFVNNGGGIAGVHQATDVSGGSVSWDWWDGGPDSAVGTIMHGHAPTNINNLATVQVADRNHLSTRDLPETWQFGDEHYSYANNVRGTHHVLMTLDEESYNLGGNPTMGADHPISWCKPYDGGRVWVTGMGHFEASFLANGGDNHLMTHIVGGTRWAAGEGGLGDCGGTIWENFERTILTTEAVGAMGLKVAENGDVYWTEIGNRPPVVTTGNLRMYEAATGDVHTVGAIPIQSDEGEERLLGLALDPDFTSNRFVYIYVPPLQEVESAGSMGHNSIIRYTLNAAGTAIVPGSEQEILRIARVKVKDGSDGTGHPCNNIHTAHAGAGTIAFDSDGSLYVGTGDGVNPMCSDGYTPIDDRFNWRYDARATSANSNSLMGKVLRIKPLADASGNPGVGSTYEIPEGNLFDGTEGGGGLARPEIYAMGFRNPFTVTTDPDRPGVVGVGEYGPDNGSNSGTRGPAGVIEWNHVTEAGFYGWPYCTGDNSTARTYNRYDFTTSTSGAKFDCSLDEIPNESPLNTGLDSIPGPAIAADVWRQYGNQQPNRFGNLGGQMQPASGPIYRFDPASQSESKWPAYFDGSWLIWNRGAGAGEAWNEVRFGGGDQLAKVSSIFGPGGLGSPTHDWVFGSEFGPDGALYLTQLQSDSATSMARIFRIAYTANDCLEDETPPTAQVNVTGNRQGEAFVNFATVSITADDDCAGVDTIEYSLDDGDTWTEYQHSFPVDEPGHHTVTFRATDHFGNTSAPDTHSFELLAVADYDPPVVTGELGGSQDENDYYVTAATLSLSAVDELSQVASIEYRIAEGEWQVYDAPVSFDEAGFYFVEFRATDTAPTPNVSEIGSLDFSVIPACAGAHSDEFDGTQLNTARWDFRHSTTPAGAISVAGGSLVMPTGETQLDGGDAGPVNFIGQAVPDGTNWTATAKLSMQPSGGWQFAGLHLWGSDASLYRATFTHNSGQQGTTFFETSKDVNDARSQGSATGSSSSNPSTVGIRLTRSGNSITSQYSLNIDDPSPTWNTIPEPSGGVQVNVVPPLDGPGARLGLITGGNYGADPVDVSFDWFRVEPDVETECPDPDVAPPSVAATTDPAVPDGEEGWFRTRPGFILAATDNVSAPADLDLEYRFEGEGAYASYAAPVTVPDGVHVLRFRGTDEVGNISAPQVLGLKVDSVPPTATHELQASAGGQTLEVTATDTISGVAAIQYDDGSGWQAYDPAAPPSWWLPGDYTVQYRAFDEAGNSSQPASVSFRLGTTALPLPRPALNVKAAPSRPKAKRAGKVHTVRVRINGRGQKARGKVKVCVKAPKKRVRIRGRKCRSVASPAVGKAKVLRFKLRARPALARKGARVRFAVTSPGVKRVNASIRIRPRR